MIQVLQAFLKIWKNFQFLVHSFILKPLWQVLTAQWQPRAALQFPAPSHTHTHTPDGFLCMLFPCFKRTLHLHWKLVLCVCPGREDILFLLSAVQFFIPCPHCLSCPCNALPLCVYRGLPGSSSPRWNTGIILSMEPVGAVLSCSAGSLCILQETDFKIIPPRAAGVKNLFGN